MSRDSTSVRLSEQGKEQLIKLKRITGIKQWNVLCRWALCVSLADSSPPLIRDVRTDSNVEMSWRTFAGGLGTAFTAAVRLRMRVDGDDDFDRVLTAHVHRGIGMLAGLATRQDSIDDLILMGANP
jgi:DNA sulfur modification protein DndE